MIFKTISLPIFSENNPPYLLCSSIIILMRREKKVKTDFFCPPRPSILLAKRRHCSIVFNLKEDSLKVAGQIVEEMLMTTFQEELNKETYIHYLNHLMGEFEALGNSFFGLDRKQQPPQIYNTCDCEPEPENPKTLEVVPSGHIKKLVRVPAGTLQPISQLSQEQLLQHQHQRKQRESLMHKLKRQHSQTIKTKYLSQSLPIIDKTLGICTQDDHMIEMMRRNISKQMLPKKSIKNVKMWQGEIPTAVRKQNKMVTVFKNSKAFIDRIDPTNSMYNKTVVSKDEHSGHRSSVYFDSRVAPMEDSVLARVTNLSEVSNLVEPRKEKVMERKASKDKIRFPRLSSDRQEIKNRIQHVSLHAPGKTTLKQISKTSERVRPQNSKSVAELPKIKRL